jgi:hypothetical protein
MMTMLSGVSFGMAQPAVMFGAKRSQKQREAARVRSAISKSIYQGAPVELTPEGTKKALDTVELRLRNGNKTWKRAKPEKMAFLYTLQGKLQAALKAAKG